jgi:hypothetical protein
MKHTLRRAIASAIAIPFIAGANVFAYMTAASLFPSVDSIARLVDSYNSGLAIAVSVAVTFTFGPQLSRVFGFNK